MPAKLAPLTPMAARRALLDAATAGDPDAMRAALARGADPDAKDDAGYTGVYTCSVLGHPECLEILLAAGADPVAANPFGVHALDRAAYEGHLRCLAALLRAGASPQGVETTRGMRPASPLAMAARGRKPECVALLIAHGAELDEADGRGRTPLMESIGEKGLGCMRLLLEAGADMELRDTGWSSALDLARRAYTAGFASPEAELIAPRLAAQREARALGTAVDAGVALTPKNRRI